MHPDLEQRPDWAAGVERLYRDGTEAWPRLVLSPQEWATFVAPRIDLNLETFPVLDGRGLFLVSACLLRVPGAAAAFDVEVLAPALASCRSTALASDAGEEVGQRLRVRLLQATPPGMALYRGVGGLDAWVRVVVTRELQSLLRTEARRGAQEQHALLDPHLEPLPMSPETAALRTQFRPALDAAFREAIGTLPTRDRRLLRLQLADRLSLEQLGTLYGMHPVSVSRALGRARQALVEAFRQSLKTRTGLSEESLDSSLSLMRSHMEWSLPTLLASQPD